MIRFILLTICVLIPLQANAKFKDWSAEDQRAFSAYAAITVIDVLQTSSAMNDPCNCYREANPLLPAQIEDYQLLLLNGAALYVVYNNIDKGKVNNRWRKIFKVITAIRLGAVISNQQKGVTFRYAFGN
jgi:hypothetical protein